MAELRHSRKAVLDSFETFGYEFKLPNSGHWQSSTIDPLLTFRPCKKAPV
jgi:hypothetical protein